MSKKDPKAYDVSTAVASIAPNSSKLSPRGTPATPMSPASLSAPNVEKKRRSRALSVSIGRLLRMQKGGDKSHKNDSPSSNSNKQEDIPADTPVFGVHLALQPHVTMGIPSVVHRCTEYLVETDALSLEGIFRMAGSVPEARKLRQQFDSGQDVDLTLTRNPHSVAALLKLFLRELPDPVCTFEFYDMFMNGVSKTEPRGNNVDRITKVVAQLPSAHRTLLMYLLLLLRETVQFVETSRMDAKNLATVFAPSLLRSPGAVAQEAQDTSIASLLVQYMIEEFETIFAAYPKIPLLLSNGAESDDEALVESESQPIAVSASSSSVASSASSSLSTVAFSASAPTFSGDAEVESAAAGINSFSISADSDDSATSSPSVLRKKTKRLNGPRLSVSGPSGSDDGTGAVRAKKKDKATTKLKKSKPKFKSGDVFVHEENRTSVTPSELFMEAVQQSDFDAAVRISVTNPGQVNFNYQDDRGWTPLTYAANRQDVDILNFLVERGANVNHQNKAGETPLHRAATIGALPCVKRLLRANADPSITDANGFTPLLVAAYCGSRDIILALLDHGVDVNGRDTLTRKTALHMAAFRGNFTSCKLLLERRAVTDVVDAYGWSALMFAAHAGHENIVTLFLEHRVPINLESVKGQTAISLAQAAGHAGVVSIMSKPLIKKRPKKEDTPTSSTEEEVAT